METLSKGSFGLGLEEDLISHKLGENRVFIDADWEQDDEYK